jgi:EmrB/QacA subfamily drug resistance transporter
MSKETHEPKGLKKWLPLAVLGLAILIIVIDTTLLNVSLGTIIRDLHTNIESLQWVIAAYSLTLAALTITGGRLGDLFGRRRFFILGAVIFAMGSLVASLSHSVGTLLIGESIIEGIGAALMMPATASLLVSTYHGRDRAVALGAWGGIAAVGAAIGPLLGGYLTSHFSWRWGFRINVVVAALLVLGAFIIKDARDREEKPTLDIVGVLLSAFGLLLGVFSIIEGATYGWIKALRTFYLGKIELSFGSVSVVPIALILSVVLLSAFVAWELRMVKRNKTPLVSMKLFANKQFTSGALTTMIFSLGQIGLLFVVPVFLQAVRGLDALHTGYALVPMSVALFISAPLSGRLSAKFSPKHITQVGLALEIIALGVLGLGIGVTASVWHLVPGMALYGFGAGLCIAQLSNLTLSAVSVNEVGEASGVNNTLRQVGASLGTAIVGAVLLTSISGKITSGIQASNVFPEASRTSLAAEVTAQTSAVEFGAKLRTKETLNETEKAEIKRISNEATVHGNHIALIYMAVAALGALGISTMLPAKPRLSGESLANTPKAAH